MDPVSFDLFLLLVALVLTGIILFLSLVSVIYTVRLAYKMDTLIALVEGLRPVSATRRAERAGEAGVAAPVPESAVRGKPPVAPAESRAREKFDPDRDAPDIESGISRIAEIYGFRSLTLSTPDGLVVASSRKAPADELAARVSYARLTGTLPVEGDVFSFPVRYRENELLGIVEGVGSVPEGTLSSLQEDIGALLGRWV
ncbi:MAG: hypothetical protein QFX32_00170 [Methanolinea sp.]|nr:hypothetical protein [Methanolinea sp.]